MPSVRSSVFAVALAALLAPTVAALAQGADHVERAAFRSGGVVHLQLNSGDVTVVPGKSDSIIVRWTGKNADDAHATIQVTGEDATVRTSGERDEVQYTIELPRESDVIARCTAGDLRIGAFDGDVDASLRFGDLHVTTLAPSAYADVDASVTIGDLGQQGFETSTHGTIGKSFHVSGHGSRRLHAHVGVGDLSLSRGADAAASPGTE